MDPSAQPPYQQENQPQTPLPPVQEGPLITTPPPQPPPKRPPLDWHLIGMLAFGFVIVMTLFIGGAYVFGVKQYDSVGITSNYEQTTIKRPDASKIKPTISAATESATPKSNQKASPDGSFIISEELMGDYNKITLINKTGVVITDDIVKNNGKEIGYNEKFRCSCATYFKSWISSSVFTIQVVNGGGEEYEFQVDATTGKVNESTFKRVR